MSRWDRVVVRVGAMVAVGALTAACTPTDPGIPTPTPAPTSSTPTESAQEREQRVAFEAAEKAYRTFQAEYDRVSAAKGGSGQPTKVMTSTAAGPYLKVMSGFLKSAKEQGLRAAGPSSIAYVHHVAYSPQEVTLKSCEDGSKISVLNPQGKKVGQGNVLELTLYARPIGGIWKIWNGDDKSVKSCG